jgi:hypothetical protein
MKKHQLCQSRLFTRTTLTALVAAVAVVSLACFSASAEEEFVEHQQKPLEPATRYSGHTPIDLKNGVLFDNGTYGLRNANYEKWAAEPVITPGISTLNYPFAEKQELIHNLQESAQFIDDAIANWKITTSITRPEAKAYGEQSVQTMQPLLDKFRDTIKIAANSSASDWEKNQSDARRELASVYGTYTSLHKNVH